MNKSTFSLLALIATIGLNGCAGIQPTQSSEFSNFLSEYNSFDTKKALAVTLDNNRVSSYGYSYSHPSQTQANKTALTTCEALRIKNKIKSECKLYMEGDVAKFDLP